MNDEIRRILAKVQSTPDFSGVDLRHLNASSADGDNVLHVVVGWGDLAAAKALLDAGIDVNKAGDLGYTPLHVACMKGNLGLVKLLVERGADLFAMAEGDLPFASARLAGADHICDFLAPLVKERVSRDPKAYLRARIAQLRREADRLQQELESS